jgi:hypothetical protein
LASSLRTASLALCCGLGVALPVFADEQMPDMALLEYLGSWDESDEDWVLLVDDDELQSAQEQERSDPADDKESQESDHES